MERWRGLATGSRSSRLLRHLPPRPPLALEPAGRRFAVGTDKGLEAVHFR